MRIATASLNQSPLDWNRNAENIRAAVEWTRKQNTNVLCLPELCISSIGCGMQFKQPEVLEKSLDILFELLPDLKDMIVTLGLPLEYDGHTFNAACLVVDGKIEGFQIKTNYSAANMMELGWFTPWSRNRHTTFELRGETYRIGDLLFEFNLNESKTFRVAIEIGENLGTESSASSADLLFNPTASRFAFGKYTEQIRHIESATKEHNYIHVVSNYTGWESESQIYDGGSFIAEKGMIVAATPRFSYHDAQVAWTTLGEESPPPVVADSFDKNEELSRAVPLGILDYLRKNKAKGFVLPISGEADSVTLAILTLQGIRFAQTELGVENFAEQFGFIPDITEAKTPQEVLNKILVCVVQDSKNDDEEKRNAVKIAASLGAEFYELCLDTIIDDYVKIVSSVIDRNLAWETDALVLRHLQDYVRVPSARLIAETDSRILLSSNDDFVGSFNPFAGISGIDAEFASFLREAVTLAEE
jgi:NAD+ synthase (glutamine-hydrolysing)